jgi:hypothetical protein
MHSQNRRKDDNNHIKSCHYHRKPGEAREIGEFLRICLDNHRTRDFPMDKNGFRDCLRTFLDCEFSNPIPGMIRKMMKVVTLQTYAAKRRENRCPQKNNK